MEKFRETYYLKPINRSKYNLVNSNSVHTAQSWRSKNEPLENLVHIS